jgi:hypothetical protein
MGRLRGNLWGLAALLLLLLGALVPASAQAAAYTWALPQQFPTGPGDPAGAVPDSYGATPWAFGDGTPFTPFTAGYQSGTIDNGYSGWEDASTHAFLAVQAAGGEALVAEPAVGSPVAVVWTSPFSHTASVQITGSVGPLSSSGSCGSDTALSWFVSWPGGSSSGSFPSSAVSVPPGGQVTLSLARADQDSACRLSDALTLELQARDPAPAVHLTGPDGNPVLTASPGLSGLAEARAPVYVLIYAGSPARGEPVRVLQATPTAGHTFSVSVAPALVDGTYTALAGQQDLGAVGYSQPVSFRVKAHAPALSALRPAPGGRSDAGTLSLGGRAGALSGDLPRVSITLYTLSGRDGVELGRRTVSASHGVWSLRWPHALGLGLYTAVIVQSDDYGHVATVLDRFMVIPASTRPLRGSRPRGR